MSKLAKYSGKSTPERKSIGPNTEFLFGPWKIHLQLMKALWLRQLKEVCLLSKSEHVESQLKQEVQPKLEVQSELELPLNLK
jgi:hypothetical protein